MTGDNAEAGERLSPGRAFALLGNETRLDILRALWAADGMLSFSALRNAVGTADSGQFNYHLRQLLDTYVDHDEDGYELSPAGMHVMSAILAGAVDRSPRLGTVPVDGDCIHCGGDLEAQFETVGVVRCSVCGETVMSDAFPPAGGIDRAPEEIPWAFDKWLRNRSAIARQGVCPQCAAPVDTTVDIDTARTIPVRGKHRCRNCKHEENAPVFYYALDHPAVVSLFYEHGIDLRELPYWEVRRRLGASSTSITCEDPLRIVVTVPVEDRRVRLTFDDQLHVVDVAGPDPITTEDDSG